MFTIIYDDGISKQVLTVPHDLYNSDVEFRKNVISMKCLCCGFEFDFTTKKEINQ